MATYTSWNQVTLMQRQRTKQVLSDFKTTTHVVVRERTPIDTGFARSRWEEFPQGAVTLGREFGTQNDASYIVKLEYGYSKQAPHGMARITAAESQQRLDASARKYVK